MYSQLPFNGHSWVADSHFIADTAPCTDYIVQYIQYGSLLHTHAWSIAVGMANLAHLGYFSAWFFTIFTISAYEPPFMTTALANNPKSLGIDCNYSSNLYPFVLSIGWYMATSIDCTVWILLENSIYSVHVDLTVREYYIHNVTIKFLIWSRMHIVYTFDGSLVMIITC